MLHRRANRNSQAAAPAAPAAPGVSKPEFLLYTEPDKASAEQAKAAAAQIDKAVAKKYPAKG